ncbi:hypothetical protein RISK_002128 [Rhodopirellula islandica]|uniref:Uncharacterized protein n=1 Tax=Rhodopirellula islandica TaxID=595434 RepID=A0A0J1BG43_RHOIS|nr:hypothetical protein RISK_002128 [Rhodopirellula islandica]
MHVDQHGRPGVGYALGEIDTSVIAIFAPVVLGDGGQMPHGVVWGRRGVRVRHAF